MLLEEIEQPNGRYKARHGAEGANSLEQKVHPTGAFAVVV